MASAELDAAAGQVWAEALGCGTQLPSEPGAHLVPGGAGLRDLRGVYMAGIGRAVFVYCPDQLRSRAATVLAATAADELFTARTCATIAGVPERQVAGPSWHGFTDATHFTRAAAPAGRRLDRDLDRDDALLAGLRADCGDGEWAEGGFADPDGAVYGLEEHGRLAAAGNLTPLPRRSSDAQRDLFDGRLT